MAKLSLKKRTPRVEAIAKAAAEASNIQNRKCQSEAGQARDKEVFDHMRKTWPHLFGLEVANRPPPLKLGILEDIFATGIEHRTAVRRVIARWCRRQEYRKQLIRGGARLDLAGNPVGEVTPEEQQQARTALALAARKGKKKAPQQPQVNLKPTPEHPRNSQHRTQVLLRQRLKWRGNGLMPSYRIEYGWQEHREHRYIQKAKVAKVKQLTAHCPCDKCDRAPVCRVECSKFVSWVQSGKAQ